jgi:hypothetical protein
VAIELLDERYAAQIAGVLSCWDRVLIFDTLPKICYAGGISSYLHKRQARIFDCGEQIFEALKHPRMGVPVVEGIRKGGIDIVLRNC